MILSWIEDIFYIFILSTMFSLLKPSVLRSLGYFDTYISGITCLVPTDDVLVLMENVGI